MGVPPADIPPVKVGVAVVRTVEREAPVVPADAARLGARVLVLQLPPNSGFRLPEVYRVPHVDDDASVSQVEFTLIPAKALRHDEAGRPLPESARVRVVASRGTAQAGPAAGLFGPPEIPPLGVATALVTVPDAHERTLAAWLVFEVIETVHPILERWAGRPIAWGNGGQLTVDIDGLDGPASRHYSYAAYFPDTRVVALSSIPTRDPETGEEGSWSVAKSRDAVAHEAVGHAAGQVIKPNAWTLIEEIPSSRVVSARFEDLGDQGAMWSSLLRTSRAAALLRTGNLRGQNALSLFAEGVARAINGTAGIRDASALGSKPFDIPALGLLHGAKGVGGVLTQLSYACFADILEQRVREGTSTLQAVQETAEVMGVLSMRMMDYLPENKFRPDDIAHAYLAADHHLFRERHWPVLVPRLVALGMLREDPRPSREFLTRTLPDVRIGSTDLEPSHIDDWLERHRNALGLPPGYSARAQEIVHLNDGRTLLRTQLFRGEQATFNHGNLLFDPQGRPESAHPTFPRHLNADRVGIALDSVIKKGIPSGHLPVVVPDVTQGAFDVLVAKPHLAPAPVSTALATR